jgi:adenine-specific DNA-methyltransferase
LRYIGNKTKLLDFIDGVMGSLGIRSGTFCDLFAGTASVARHMKSKGFQVVCGDIMRYSYVLQRAYVVVNQYPRFVNLPGEVELNSCTRSDNLQEPLLKVILYLNQQRDGQDGFIYRNYCPGGSGGRRLYFTDENGRRIDAVRQTLDRWKQEGGLSRDEYYILLAALIEATDAVANISGVYCSFLKDLQPNARRRLHLRPPSLVTENPQDHRAHQGDANDLITGIRCDVLYLDPPYNIRQYACNYHLLESIAEGWSHGEPRIYGKTGMRPYKHQRSRYCSRRGGQRALADLVQKAREKAGCSHLLLSYNDEGVIPGESIESILREVGVSRTYRKFERAYRRFRSDSDGPNRRYRRGDQVTESLYYVRLR